MILLANVYASVLLRHYSLDQLGLLCICLFPTYKSYESYRAMIRQRDLRMDGIVDG